MYFPVSAADVLRECAVLHRNRVLPRLFFAGCVALAGGDARVCVKERDLLYSCAATDKKRRWK